LSAAFWLERVPDFLAALALCVCVCVCVCVSL